MGDYMAKIEKSALMALPVDAAVEQGTTSDGGTTARATPVSGNSPVLTDLRKLIQDHGNHSADVAPQQPGLGELPPELMAHIASKLELNAAKTLRRTNRAFRATGALRFTGADVPSAAKARGMAQFFSDSTNICTLRITDKNNFRDQNLARLIDMLPEHGAKISHLDLGGCWQITDAGLSHLSGMAAMESLNLGGCWQTTDAGLRHLSGMTAMQSLNFFGCRQITDAGMGHLSGMTTIQTLNLHDCRHITDVGLGQLSRMTTMQSLGLVGCASISETVLNQLRERGIRVRR